MKAVRKSVHYFNLNLETVIDLKLIGISRQVINSLEEEKRKYLKLMEK
jgi:hypothetical protein